MALTPLGRGASKPKQVTGKCRCGDPYDLMVGHYEVLKCTSCGYFLWALQPHEYGPFELRRWPGTAKKKEYDTPQPDTDVAG